MTRKFNPWLLAIAWMALIFILSSDVGSASHTSRLVEPFLRSVYPGISPRVIEWVHFALRKAGHVTGYAILALLMLRSVHFSLAIAPGTWSWRAARWALFASVVYAISDEFHQWFVASRGAAASDVAIDSLGAVIALTLAFAWKKRKESRRTAPAHAPGPRISRAATK